VKKGEEIGVRNSHGTKEENELESDDSEAHSGKYLHLSFRLDV
jgi:hypothetical protein